MNQLVSSIRNVYGWFRNFRWGQLSTSETKRFRRLQKSLITSMIWWQVMEDCERVKSVVPWVYRMNWYKTFCINIWTRKGFLRNGWTIAHNSPKSRSCDVLRGCFAAFSVWIICLWSSFLTVDERYVDFCKPEQ